MMLPAEPRTEVAVKKPAVQALAHAPEWNRSSNIT